MNPQTTPKHLLSGGDESERTLISTLQNELIREHRIDNILQLLHLPRLEQLPLPEQLQSGLGHHYPSGVPGEVFVDSGDFPRGERLLY